MLPSMPCTPISPNGALHDAAPMSGETDLAAMLASLTIGRRDEVVTMVSVSESVELGNGVLAVVTEAEGTTVVVTLAEAERRGWPVEFVAAWLTVEVHSSLEAVGLTAAMSRVLTDCAIPCNVLAGFYHDHLLVPLDLVADAIAALESLAD